MQDKLELAEMIKGLRAQLEEAQAEGAGKDIRFDIENVELELEVAAGGKIDGGVSSKFFVLTSQVNAEKNNTIRHKIKLNLKPVAENGAELLISDQDEMLANN